MSKNFPFFGIVLILLGVLMFLQALGLIEESLWRFFWPGIIILVGSKVAYNELKR